MSIFFDLDGVLRDLCGAAGIAPEEYHCKIQGKHFVEYFDEHMELLRLAKPTEYLPIAKIFHKYIGITILTNQQQNWKPSALDWILEHFGKPRPSMLNVENSDKWLYINEGDILVEDNPEFMLIPGVVIVARSYNKGVPRQKRITNPDALFKEICRRIK